MSIEYLKPEDRYDIEVFNRNFKAVEDAANEIRPLDWISLPDISQETAQKVVMLLFVGKNQKNRLFSFVSLNNATDPINVIVDFGDGTETTEPFYVSGTTYYFLHDYDYDTLDAPITSDGYKQVIVTFSEDPDKPSTHWLQLAMNTSIYSTLGNFYSNYSMLRDIAVQAGTENAGLQVSLSSSIMLKSVKAYNVKQVTATICESLRQLIVTGSNCTYISTSYADVQNISIPEGNSYTTLSLGTQSRTKEIILHGLENCTSYPSFSTSRCLERLELHGLRRKFTLTYAPMKREAIIALFESLGNADMTLSDSNRTIDLTSLTAYGDLTDDDKQIAIDKGYIVT